MTTDWQVRPEVATAQRRTLTLLSAAQILGGIGSGAGLSVGILLAEQVTSSEGWAGLARSGTTVGAALFAIPMAAVAIRAGRRVALGGGWLMAAVGSMLLVLAAEWAGSTVAVPLLIVGMVLAGFGSAANFQSRYAAIDIAPPNRRSRDLSLVVWSTTIGSVLGPNLATPGAALSEALGLRPFAGPFVIAVVMQVIGAGMLMFLRPDPLLLAARFTGGDLESGSLSVVATGEPDGTPATGKVKAASGLAIAWRIPAARGAFVAICCAHTVMVGVMTMTPVHMDHHGATIGLVGLTISLHVLGMFAFSPLVGLAADRFGRERVIGAGFAVLLAATAVAGTAGESATRVTIGLFLVGVGWSLCLVSASALLSEAVPAAHRTRVQGVADASMNACAAIGAGLSGPLLGLIGFGGLNLLAAGIVLLATPILVARIRQPVERVSR